MKVSNYISGGKTRCVQASYRMIMAAYTGEDPGKTFADDVTGYVEGRGTWQFRMMLALADAGLHVVDHEIFDAELFVDDPHEAIRKQVQDEAAINAIIAETDFTAETEAVRKCLASPYVSFIRSVPTLSDIEQRLDGSSLVIANVDLQVLRDKPEREGHILLLESISDTTVVAHDPGPNGSLSQEIDRDLFTRSWKSPSPEMANYIAVSTGS